jgi:hypothetical protein
MKRLSLLAIYTFVAGYLLAVPAARAQRVLLRSNVGTDTLRSKVGPNRAFFQHFYLGYDAVVGRANGPGADLRSGASGQVLLGVRQKYRLNQTAALGFDLRYARLVYQLAQNDRKVLPTSTQHKREHLALPQFQAEAFARLSLSRRGNVVGNYLDLLGWGGWVISTAHHYEDSPGPTGSGRVEVTERELNYIRRWSYGVGARLGSGRYAVVARHRLSDTFTSAAATRYPELPRWVVGLELGMF